MQTTLRTVAEEIAASLGQQEDLMSIELIKQRVLHFRQLILKRDFEKTQNFPPQVIMSYDVKLTQMTKFGTKAYVSDALPAALLTTSNEPFISVSNSLIDTQRKVYGYVSTSEVEYIQYRMFSKLDDYYTFENNRLISFSKDQLRVKYVPENPLDVIERTPDHDYKYICGDSLHAPCFDEDDLILEQTLAAAILTFFGQTTRRNVPTASHAIQEEN